MSLGATVMGTLEIPTEIVKVLNQMENHGTSTEAVIVQLRGMSL